MAPPKRTNTATAWSSPSCAEEPAQPFDELIGRGVRLLYMAVSAFSGDSMPSAFFNTFLAQERAAFDGVFVLQAAQVERIIANSESLSARVRVRKRLLVQAFSHVLSDAITYLEPDMVAWARSIVGRLEEKAQQTGANAYEDITTQDLSDAVDPDKRGEWVQLAPEDAFSTYISFGQIGLYFSGRATLAPATAMMPATVHLELRPVIFDVFDFHFLSEDPGTGWADHALARLQCAGVAKPFRVEGFGRPFHLVAHGKGSH